VKRSGESRVKSKGFNTERTAHIEDTEKNGRRCYIRCIFEGVTGSSPPACGGAREVMSAECCVKDVTFEGVTG
jgi:hypothetical protein